MPTRFLSWRWLRANPTVPAILLVAVVYVSTLCILEKRDFWVVDNANKFLQMQAIIQSDYADYSIPWLGQALDPEFTLNPFTDRFSKIEDGRMYSVFAPFFATISSFFFRAFGYWGLYILPVLSSLLMLVAVSKLTWMFSPEPLARFAAVLLAGLCTPVWFYSVVFWEHTAAVCFCVWAVLWGARYLRDGSIRTLVLGSAAVSCSIYFRDDLYIFAVVFVAVMFATTAGKRVKNSAIAVFIMIGCLVPLWLFQWKTIGHPLGFHIESTATFTPGILEYFETRPKVFYSLFAALHPNVWVSLALASPFLLLLLSRPKLEGSVLTWAVPGLVLAALAGSLFSLLGYLSSANPIEWMFSTNSLFAASPVLVLAFFRPREQSALDGRRTPEQWVWMIALVFSVLYGMATYTGVGIHWGNRFLLLLYPLFCALAGSNLIALLRESARRLDWRKLTVALVVLVSLGAQMYSVYLLREKKKFSYLLNEAIRHRTEKIVVTNIPWVAQTLFSEFYNKSYFAVPELEQLEDLFAVLQAHGYRRCVVVTQPSAEDGGLNATTVVDERLGYYSLSFVPGSIVASEE